MSYWQLKSIHGDQVMRTKISEQPDADHHLRAGDDEEKLGKFLLWYCKISQGILFIAKLMADGWLWRVCLILQDFPLKVSKTPSRCSRALKSTPLLSGQGKTCRPVHSRWGLQIHCTDKSAFHPLFAFFVSRSLQCPRSYYDLSLCTNPQTAGHLWLGTRIFRQVSRLFMFIQGS